MQRMIRRLSIALVSLLCVAWFSTPAAQAQSRPTFREARTASHMVLDDQADLLDGRLIAGPCARRGVRTVVCRVRIVGPAPQRYRVIVTPPKGHGRWWVIRARPVYV